MSDYIPPDLPAGIEYHAFISHSMKSKEDTGVVRKIRKVFEDHNLKGCDVDEDFIPGQSIDGEINKCIRKSNKIVFIVSNTFLQSVYMPLEMGIAIYREGETRKVTIIPILIDTKIEDLPKNLRRNNVLKWGEGEEPEEPNFWDRFLKEICSEEESTLVITGDFFHGLAWSYFYGYLKLVLPGLRDRVKKHEEEFKKNGNEDVPFLSKMMIILPDSGFCPGSLTDDDKNLVHQGCIPYKATRAGNVGRDYKSAVYKVKHPETQEECFVIAEFATPLMSMYEMEEGDIADLSAEEKLAQKRLFEIKLKEILEHKKNKACHGSYTFLSFEDPRKEVPKEDDPTKIMLKPDGWSLSKLIAEEAFAKLKFDEGVKETKANLETAN